MGKKRSNKNKEINVAFVADKGYLMPTAVAVTSLAANMDPEYVYNIFIVTLEHEYPAFERIKEFFKGVRKLNIEIRIADDRDLKGLHSYEDDTYLAATETSLLKFKLPEILHELDRVIFLDGDILVKDDLTELYDTDLQGNTIGAARDLPQVIYDVQEIGAEINGSDYFNSGVMVLDLAKMRKEDKMSELIEAKRMSNDSTLMDQNIFNTVFKGDTFALDFRYNVCYTNLIYSMDRYDMSRINSLYGTDYENAFGVRKDSRIIHFSSKTKPWLFYDVPLADEWLFYYKMSPFGDEIICRTWHKSRDVDKKELKKETDRIKEGLEKAGKKDKKGSAVPIVFATDGEYFFYAAAAIRSVMENGSKDRFYDINVLTDETVPEHMAERLEKYTSGNLSVKVWDVRNCFDGIDLYSVGHYSKQMYYRWLIPEIFNYYDKVLYLDCDVVLTKDPAELFDTDIGDHCIAAVNNYVRTHLEGFITGRLGLGTDEYYNTGVLLINSKRFSEEGLKEKCTELLKNSGKLACPDQDVLNVICRGKVFKLPDEWNFQWHHRFEDIVSGELLPEHEERYERQEKKLPYIIHYTSQVKPWNDPGRKYADIFWKYCKETGFYENVLIGQFKRELEREVGKEREEKERVIRENREKEENSRNEIAGLQKGINELQYIISETRKSKTYKIGRAVTAIPRRLKELLDGEMNISPKKKRPPRR